MWAPCRTPKASWCVCRSCTSWPGRIGRTRGRGCRGRVGGTIRSPCRPSRSASGGFLFHHFFFDFFFHIYWPISVNPYQKNKIVSKVFFLKYKDFQEVFQVSCFFDVFHISRLQSTHTKKIKLFSRVSFLKNKKVKTFKKCFR